MHALCAMCALLASKQSVFFLYLDEHDDDDDADGYSVSQARCPVAMFSALGLTSKIVMQKYYQIFSEHGFRALVRSWSYIFSTFLS